MGMDISGNNQSSVKGAYYHNNIWWWRPLWNYCCDLHGDLADKVANGHTNDGDGLNAADSLELGRRLLNDIATGVTAQYGADYREGLASLPMVECEYCQATGIRTDTVGISMGMPTKELALEDSILFGRTHGYCNACDGFGKQSDFRTHYPFSVDNVQGFADFLVECEGFGIY